ncbi:MAG TPA: NUDIX hydrolase [Oscillatoriaceae cyanobacterium]
MDLTANPWQVRDSRRVYDNPWIRVREDQVTRPDGQPGIYGVVEFKNRAIGVVPVTAEGETILVGQYRYPLGHYSWEIVEGGGPLDSDLLESAKRELREETGITAARWTYLGELATSNSVTDEIGCVFLAEELTYGEPEPEGTERLQTRRVPLEEAFQMALTGEISDALAVIGLARAYHYLQSKRSVLPVARSFPGYGEAPARF